MVTPAPAGFEWYQPSGPNVQKQLRPIGQPAPGPSAAQGLASTFTPEYFSNLKTTLGEAPTVAAPANLASQFSGYAPQAVTGLGEDYYTTQRNQMRDALRQEFFGPLGTVQQTASSESAAGRLDSGVGKRVIAESALNPFAQGSAAIDQNVMQAQAQEQAQLRQFNADQQGKFQGIMATLSAADSSNALDAAKATASLRSDYNGLLAKIADAEAGRLSTEAIAQLEADVRLWEAASKERSMQSSSNVDMINAQINYLNSIGQYKTPSPTLDTKFGLPSTPVTAAPTAAAGGQPSTPGQYDGQISPDGKWRYNARARNWGLIYG